MLKTEPQVHMRVRECFFYFRENTWHGNPTIIKVLGGNRIISFGRKKVNFQRPILILLPIVRTESGFTPLRSP